MSLMTYNVHPKAINRSLATGNFMYMMVLGNLKLEYEKRYKLKKTKINKYLNLYRLSNYLKITKCIKPSKNGTITLDNVYSFVNRSTGLHGIALGNDLYVHPDMLFRYVARHMKNKIKRSCGDVQKILALP